MSRVFHVDGDDVQGLIAALQACGMIEGGPAVAEKGGLIITHVYHEPWCPKPNGGQCVCREEYRDPTTERIALAKRRARNKAARKSRRKGRQ